jgi:magnesium-transporting ATPase (P-type)
VAGRRGALRRFLAQLDNLLIDLLIAAAVLAALVGHFIDSLVILAVVIVNTAIGFFQEGKAEDALEAIKGLIDPEATVRRDGRRQRSSDEVVPGDLVLIERATGCRPISGSSGQEPQAGRAGAHRESVPVEKGSSPSRPAPIFAERRSMAFHGTFVAAGQGGASSGDGGADRARPDQLHAGRGGRARDTARPQMAQFARHVTLDRHGGGGAGLPDRAVRAEFGLVQSFKAVVGLFVAAIPEGLPPS